MLEYQEEIINNIKYYREVNNLTQEDLAEMCCCATSTIGCIESGKQLPSFCMMIKISNALKINPADLFIRNASKLEGTNLLNKYSELIDDCEKIPKRYLKSVSELAKNLAQPEPEYGPSRD